MKCGNPNCSKEARGGTFWAKFCSDKCKSLVNMRLARGIDIKRPVRVRRDKKKS